MSHSLVLNEPSTTQLLIDKLNLVIDETGLARRIMDMNHRAENIELTTGASMRTWRLREEVKNLETELVLIRNRKQFC